MKKLNPRTIFVFKANNQKAVTASDPTVETITVLTTLGKPVKVSPQVRPANLR